MANKVKIDFERMQKIKANFEHEETDLQDQLNKTRQQVNDLRTNWIGQGSASFFDDMDNKVLPSLENLIKALGQTAAAVGSILDIFHQADQEGSSSIKSKLQGIDRGAWGGVGGGGIRPGPVPGGIGGRATASANNPSDSAKVDPNTAAWGTPLGGGIKPGAVPTGVDGSASAGPDRAGIDQTVSGTGPSNTGVRDPNTAAWGVSLGAGIKPGGGPDTIAQNHPGGPPPNEGMQYASTDASAAGTASFQGGSPDNSAAKASGAANTTSTTPATEQTKGAGQEMDGGTADPSMKDTIQQEQDALQKAQQKASGTDRA